jgi:hypothetical protein
MSLRVGLVKPGNRITQRMSSVKLWKMCTAFLASQIRDANHFQCSSADLPVPEPTLNNIKQKSSRTCQR